MREGCGCGAWVHGRRKDVLAWRTNHRHDSKEEPEPDKNGAESRVEHSGTRQYDQVGPDGAGQDVPVVQARIGFTPNGYSIRSVALAEKLRAKALKNLGR